MPAAAVGFQDDLRIRVTTVSDATRAVPPRQRKLTDGRGQASGDEGIEQRPFELGVWRHVAVASLIEDASHAFDTRLTRTSDLCEDGRNLRDRGLAHAKEIVSHASNGRDRLGGAQLSDHTSGRADTQSAEDLHMRMGEIADLVDERSGNPVVGAVRDRKGDRLEWQALGTVQEGGRLVGDNCHRSGRQHRSPQIAQPRVRGTADRIDPRVHAPPGATSHPVTDGGLGNAELERLRPREDTGLSAGK